MAAIETDQALTLIAVAGAPTLLAAADPGAALDLIPVTSGLGGAIVASMRAHMFQPTPQQHQGRFGWVPILISGAAATVFGSPALAEFLGWRSPRAIIFLHFLIGLLGSAFCDLILRQSDGLSRGLGNIVLKVLGLIPAPVPPAPPASPEQLPIAPTPDQPKR